MGNKAAICFVLSKEQRGRRHPIKKPGEETSCESGAVVPNEHLSSNDLAGIVEALTGERVTPRRATGNPAGATRAAKN